MSDVWTINVSVKVNLKTSKPKNIYYKDKIHLFIYKEVFGSKPLVDLKDMMKKKRIMILKIPPYMECCKDPQ